MNLISAAEVWCFDATVFLRLEATQKKFFTDLFSTKNRSVSWKWGRKKSLIDKWFKAHNTPCDKLTSRDYNYASYF